MDVEWLILADAADIVANKLYLLGGGWDTLTVSSGFPAQQACAVAASFLIPWNETNEKHAVTIDIESEDGAVLATVQATVEVGRPPGITPGTPQRAQVVARMNLGIPAAGAFAIIARVGGEEAARTAFRVVEARRA